MRFFKGGIVFLWMFVMFMPLTASAQNAPQSKPDEALHHFPSFYSEYCQNATQHSDLIRCLTEHLSFAQNQLNDAYDNAIKLAPESGLEALQQNWVQYRDAECEWEAVQNKEGTSNPILKKACELRVTQRRVDDLKATFEPSYKRREFALQPRWFTVLANTHPNILWNLAATQSEDTNCNTISEAVIWGQSQGDLSDKKIAIIQPQTASMPDVVLLDVSSTCAAGYNLNIIKPEPQELMEGEEPTCEPPKISFVGKDEGCEEITFIYNIESQEYLAKTPDNNSEKK